VLDLASRLNAPATGYLSRAARGVARSPDSRWVAYLGLSARGRSGTSTPFPPPEAQPGDQRHAQRQREQHLVNPDGTYLLYNTSQRTEEGAVVRVDLIHPHAALREDRFRDLSREGTGGETHARRAARRTRRRTRSTVTEPPRDPSKPVEIVFDDIRQRRASCRSASM
jgi:hypothetical protein